MAKSNNEMTGWVGWISFASLVLLISGGFSVIEGFVALFRKTVYYHASTSTLYVANYTTWGWVHIVVGALAILAAGSLMSGHMFGRVFAVLVALASLLANMAFMPVYPLWSITVMVIDVLVLFAVVVHGKELRVN